MLLSFVGMTPLVAWLCESKMQTQATLISVPGTSTLKIDHGLIARKKALERSFI
jgi:hypothetical protein